MKNGLGKAENLTLFNKAGVKVYEYEIGSNDYSSEWTYDSMGNQLTFKDSRGYSSESTYDNKGNRLTYKNSNGYSWERTYDNKGNRLTYKNSNGFSCERTYDNKGNELTYKDSTGVQRGFAIPEYTMEQLVQKLGNFKLNA